MAIAGTSNGSFDLISATALVNHLHANHTRFVFFLPDKHHTNLYASSGTPISKIKIQYYQGFQTMKLHFWSFLAKSGKNVNASNSALTAQNGLRPCIYFSLPATTSLVLPWNDNQIVLYQKEIVACQFRVSLKASPIKFSFSCTTICLYSISDP